MEICRYFQRLIMFCGYGSIKRQTEMAGFFQNHTQRDDQRSHLHLIQKGNIFRFFKRTSSHSVRFLKLVQWYLVLYTWRYQRLPFNVF